LGDTGCVSHRTPATLEFAQIWQAAEKIVYSTTLQTVSTAKTRIERRFEPDMVRALKAGATRDVAVAGPALAAHAIRAGLVDEYHLFIAPIIVGSGNPYLPGKVPVKRELLNERRFDNGMVHVRYRSKSVW
jgi:riboflavin biosynthesis pyrimidine reductase